MYRVKIKSSLMLILLLSAPLCIDSASAADVTTNALMDHMRFLSERDKVISGNIANSETPKFLPIDIQKQSKDISEVRIYSTHPRHISLDNDPQYSKIKAPIDEIKPNGNAVTLEQEMLKKSDNAMEFQQAITLYNKMRGLVNGAITMGAGQ
ncbi:MAG: hypothetical protein JSS50_00630 [Proteobacteria bacterium]|nr:hypothetical protein [Pseudomonadota bacterium]